MMTAIASAITRRAYLELGASKVSGFKELGGVSWKKNTSRGGNRPQKRTQLDAPLARFWEPCRLRESSVLHGAARGSSTARLGDRIVYFPELSRGFFCRLSTITQRAAS